MQQKWFLYCILSILIELFISYIFNCQDLLGLVSFTIVIYIVASSITKFFKPLCFNNIGSIFFVSLLLSLLFFIVGWSYDLQQSDDTAGYDPARYYHMAYNMAKSGTDVLSFNYVGIVYFYKYLFLTFGANPLTCIVFNVLLTHISALYLSRFIYLINNKNTSCNSGIAYKLIMFLPEIIWYDCLSSREIICMACVIVSIVNIYDVLLFKKSITKIFILAISVICIGIIRTSLILLLALCVFVIVFCYRKQINKYIFIVSSIGGVGVVVLATVLSSVIGSSDFSFLDAIEGGAKANEMDTSDFTWSTNSVGQLLVANSFSQLIWLSPFRIIGYVVAPLPNFFINIQGLFYPKYGDWQHLWTLISSLFYLYSMPGLIKIALNAKTDKRCMFVFLLFLAAFFSISCGVSYIHERYRITGVPLLILAIVISQNIAAKHKISKKIFSIGLVASLLFVLIYKIL